jgi:glutamyl-Q tRNA(Asp) synthetase
MKYARNNAPESGISAYRGRFAPSPTGHLHSGSLLAAVASYLDAKKNQGQWLLRIEDLDPPREQPGASDSICKTLEAYGFEWETPRFQSQHLEIYHQVLNDLRQNQLTYPCTCSRKMLQSQRAEGVSEIIYTGNCANRQFEDLNSDYAIRVKTKPVEIEFCDAIQGYFRQNIRQQVGDFILQRKDKLIAYQLAVVVDDQLQGITHVVRGTDLLSNTPRQIYLQTLLGYSRLEYAHLPLITNQNNRKLSKQTGATAIPLDHPVPVLCQTLKDLGQKPPVELCHVSIREAWEWAIKNWQISHVPDRLGTYDAF